MRDRSTDDVDGHLVGDASGRSNEAHELRADDQLGRSQSAGRFPR
jgi:hypothetical protein